MSDETTEAGTTTRTARWEEIRFQFTGGLNRHSDLELQDKRVRSDRDCRNDPERWRLRVEHAVDLAASMRAKGDETARCDVRSVEVRTTRSAWSPDGAGSRLVHGPLEAAEQPDELAEHFIDANERLGAALTEIGMALGLPRPGVGTTWWAPEILAAVGRWRSAGDGLTEALRRVRAYDGDYSFGAAGTAATTAAEAWRAVRGDAATDDERVAQHWQDSGGTSIPEPDRWRQDRGAHSVNTTAAPAAVPTDGQAPDDAPKPVLTFQYGGGSNGKVRCSCGHVGMSHGADETTATRKPGAKDPCRLCDCVGFRAPASADDTAAPDDERATAEKRWNDAIDWLLNSRHCADPDIQGPFWAHVDGEITLDDLQNDRAVVQEDGSVAVESWSSTGTDTQPTDDAREG